MTGTLVISLDFELMWGVRDHRTARQYGDAVLGGRQAIPHILNKFEKAGIRATWATVGLLFARSRREMLDFAPARRPKYENNKLSPYPAIEACKIGDDENSDPLHFGSSLIEKIANTPGQEIATHTYSHFYCLEAGADQIAFSADLEAAVAIASHYGHRLDSIVFPRNQTTQDAIDLSADRGVACFRGGANGWMYRPRSDQETTKLFRLARFLDGAFPVGANQVVSPQRQGPSLNLPASRFLRPWSSKLRAYHALHIRRIKSEIRLAARLGGCYHLWWHPHNFGRNMAKNLSQLETIITCYKECRDHFGMTSRNMRDFTGGER